MLLPELESPAKPSVFLKIAQDVAVMLVDKNESYGNSYAKVGELMKILFPNGVPIDRMQEALVITRVLDKLGRLANSPEAFGESPWRDIAGYAILQLALWEGTIEPNFRIIVPTCPGIEIDQ
jgi:hypothetical protein